MLGANVAGDAAVWAFPVYGGDFWVFLGKSGAFARAAETRHIVGAGVSTRAPMVPIS